MVYLKEQRKCVRFLGHVFVMCTHISYRPCAGSHAQRLTKLIGDVPVATVASRGGKQNFFPHHFEEVFVEIGTMKITNCSLIVQLAWRGGT